MNQNMPPTGPGAAPQLNATSAQTSPAAVIALILSLLSVCSSFICCLGLVPGGLAIVLGGFGIVQYRSGQANQASAIMGGVSIAISALAFVFYGLVMVFGVGAGMMESINQSAPFDVPAMQDFQPPVQPEPVPPPSQNQTY